ncbi:hypothetical protein NX059_001390 [Plenodomus lindquistii]|nr:hypothetical protein NX059_001390 [Plenodomus lindquistii]
MVNKSLGGGALLDLGIYSLSWVFMILYQAESSSSNSTQDDSHTQNKDDDDDNNNNTADPKVSSAMNLYPPTGADEQTTILLHFPTGAHAIASTSIRVATSPSQQHPSPDAIRIQGTLGDLTINYAPRPLTYTLIPASSSSRGTPATFEYKVEKKYEEVPGNGHGMFWEADECARCIRDGRCESEGMSWAESESVMRVMDKVRRQGGLGYGEEIEGVGWDGEGDGE